MSTTHNKVNTLTLPEINEENILLNWNVLPIHELSKTENIIEHGIGIELSKNIAYPKFSLGFQHFLHQSLGADKMDSINQFENKKKVYLVINSFETNVDNYNKDIQSLTNEYINNKEKVVSGKFYELWELLFIFKLVNLNNKGFISTHLGTEDGGFVQAVSSFREEFEKPTNVKSDKYYVIGSKVELKNKNITYSNTIPKINSDLVTIQINKKWKYINTQEQEMLEDLIETLLKLIKIQATGGNCVIKVHETYTTPMLHILSLLRNFYDKVYMTKPLTSQTFTSDKYIIGLGFNASSSQRNKIESDLNTILKSLEQNKGKNIVDIYSGYKPSKEFWSSVTKGNTDISNRQFAIFNQMITFIEKQNYHGDQYQQKNKEQHKANDLWTSLFLPKKSNIETHLKIIRNWGNSIINVNNSRTAQMIERIE